MDDNMMHFQSAVSHWAVEVFGGHIASNVPTRCYRFAEESVELNQALGMTKEQWNLILDYVYGRPVGEPAQEVGGVMVTLAALCAATGISLHMSAWDEHERCKRPEIMEKIRAKQRNKPNPEDVLPAQVGSDAPPSAMISKPIRLGNGAVISGLDGMVLTPPVEVNLRHTDDEAVAQFAEAMRSKMAAARAKGRSGWDDPEDCGISYLQELLVGHVYKGDPIDVANFCMMLWHRGGRTVVEDQWVYDNTGKWPAVPRKDRLVYETIAENYFSSLLGSRKDAVGVERTRLPITLEGQEPVDSRLSSDGAALVNPRAQWKKITAETPRGVKLQLINKTAGVAHYGMLDSANDFYTHYCELPVFDKDEA